MNWGRLVSLSQSRKFIAVSAAAALFLFLPLTLISDTPRARLNVAQICSFLFFLVLIARLGWARQLTEGLAKQKSSRKGLLLALALGFSVYATTLPLYFISDDFGHLFHAQSPVLQSLWEQLTRGEGGVFLRPLGFASLFLDYSLWGLWPPGYHLSNILLHLATTAGIFFLCESLEQKPETCATASLIFSVLPIQVEAVAWMGARFDLLATCLAVWALVHYARFRKNSHFVHYLLALVFFFFGMLSKENAYVLPLLLISLEFLVMPTRNIRVVVPFFLLGGIVFVYRWIALGVFSENGIFRLPG